ncbi:hypothetical protein C2E23DRAFT_805874 [Lenzites betulinus]|nr:hypothetical protein C2E23DRAFT_805874 [Lenzites betulinus]
MMSRTIRTCPRWVVNPRPHDQAGRASKRRRLEDERAHAAATNTDGVVPFRRFSVIFSSAGPPAYCDYVIWDDGVVGYASDEHPPPTPIHSLPPTASPPESSLVPTTQETVSRVGFCRPREMPPSTANSAQAQPWYQQSLSYASGPNSQSALSSVTAPPPSQSVVPSSQAHLEEDFEMCWKGSEAHDNL